MKVPKVFVWTGRWLRWAVQPPPWLIVLCIAALAGALWLCMAAPRMAAVVAVVYQVAGAVLAVWQFVSLQQEWNAGWLTREIRHWWQSRPKKYSAATASGVGSMSASTARGYGHLGVVPGTTVDEQLSQMWNRIGELGSGLAELKDDVKLQGQEFGKQLEALRHESQEYTRAAEQRVAKSLTSAPLKAATGFWLILLGLSMQVWLAVP